MKSVIVSGARTPFGKFGGHLSSLSAVELGGIAIKEAVSRASLKNDQVDEVIFGHVLQAGQGQITSRQAARAAGLPWHVKTETINKVCASGLRAVSLADQIIRAGDEKIIVAGGMESMSNTPYVLPKARWGARMGDTPLVDLMVHDGLSCSFTGVHMGQYGNETAALLEISRDEQDEWAYRSHQRAVRAIESGRLAEEIVPVQIHPRKGEPILIEKDEAPRAKASLEALAALKPIFGKEGTITAGNAPGVNDGAAALVLMNEEEAHNQGIEPLATILGHAEVATQAKDFPQTPGLVIEKLLKKTGKKESDISLFEINEAFAAVALASNKIAGLTPDKVNVNGGAIALGHPIGASGARILLTLVYELKRRGGGIGVAAICSGGGQGDAVMIEVK
ncbi:acetyl-CoA acetyltransferase [Alkalihalobacillus alcalophilus ATCC 27647 = CGMCC 1.3604]|uniref:acetyl-CoA C-acetyltransferase n=1 Tax=Alkalihalobacillus alcalophilus ATCC 27647 = CGMCC 1.3604 TaxID=1218173 RepID=A0A094XIG8_ALKAL|nr:acetyl-CoA C-acetyltransferase [Alkalihalobacillus alcalophilus]KGA98580.1 acetyl-CoA acetyltransferase [Alkalihalobacillus alcalophilus ATCC 27647 = CGMCC 1.3604]MED1560421.1 acetyl-CoA C-acetyltransferase [Alkalihalobacillus alcalophilus]THG88981.1 acetyl-CoA acetyltransferase [Alkalihalobacillus alcalophilus ATCC 27647 = CGMCC 1.3604]